MPDHQPGSHDYAIELGFAIPDASPVFYYTLDGTEPDDKTGQRLEGTLNIDNKAGVKVRAYQPGWDPSPVFSGDYSIRNYIPWFT